MTSCGPYSQATLIYEPRSIFPLGVVATPGTVLDFVGKEFPSIAGTIAVADQNAFFDASQDITLFVSKTFPQAFDKLDALDFCERFSVGKKIDAKSLSCSPYLLLKMRKDHLFVKAFLESIWINDHALIQSVNCSNGIVHVLE